MFPYFEYTFGHNISSTLAVSLPLGKATSGLPIGVQLGVKFGQEHLLLRVSQQLEESSLWEQDLPSHLLAAM